MHSESLIISTIFIALFLMLTALILSISKKIKFPYTVALLIVGFVVQFLFKYFHLETHLEISSDLIYFVLLPILLYESAFHINFHQFKLQFKSITFLATFGLLVAITTVAGLLSQFIGLGFWHGLLFGALISATDPIAVLAIFKELGAPKRLSLIAEGESMLNDATAVIIFRVIAGFVVTGKTFASTEIFKSFADFSYVFIGSLFFGFVLAYLTSMFISKIKNDELIETTMTLALALLSFLIAEHYFGLSGVITTVAAGITMGNLGRTKISIPVIHFMEKFWKYLGFLAISLVFFFTAFDLEFSILFKHPETTLLAILSVLIARAVSIYITFLITNNFSFFKNEPNVPLSWQHILNWGGLRGVIPLVLVYSLPDSYIYKEQFLVFTLATFLFTLLVNGLTIEKLLFFLKLHLPKKEEQIMQEEADIFSIQKAHQKVDSLPKDEFSPTVIHEVIRKMDHEEKKHKDKLEELAIPKDFEQSLHLEVLQIERQALNQLFNDQHINEAVFYTFQGEIDMQLDAIEYPDLYYGKNYQLGGQIPSKESFYNALHKVTRKIKIAPFLNSYFNNRKDNIIMDRLSLLQSRIVTSGEVIQYLEHITDLTKNKQINKIIKEIISEHEQYRLKNNFQIQEISREFPRLYREFETKTVETLAWL
ncbi:MAG: sodium:proton antiporter [Candidatus Pacebacteria bacterium]|nr:sodium:proton antiporter [Candidatus Paceibacterota bacterium]